jgi:hypothetical protein
MSARLQWQSIDDEPIPYVPLDEPMLDLGLPEPTDKCRVCGRDAEAELCSCCLAVAKLDVMRADTLRAVGQA